MAVAFLSLRELKKAFSPHYSAVNGMSVDVEAGQIICLLGPSGCGKTTLLRMVAGLEKPDSGQIRLNGKNIISIPPHQRDFGLMFQDYALFPHKNVFENVAFGLRLQKLKKEAIHQRVSEMLNLVGLQDFEHRAVHALSGGEQQRVALARSLAPSPHLLMLDEPLGALDRAMRERLMLDLRRIIKKIGVTAIYVTHDQTEAFAIADRVAVMNAGKVEQFDTPENIFRSPLSAFVARFLGFQNIVQGKRLPSGAVETDLGLLQPAIPLPNNQQAVTLLIRPEAALIGDKEEKTGNWKLETPNLNTCQATIADISFRGRFYQVWLETPQQRLMFELVDKPPHAIGQNVTIQLQAMDIIPIPPHSQ
jgi:ABC-type Fe3+/spermidine/putrescine transport system ATPase subunit